MIVALISVSAFVAFGTTAYAKSQTSVAQRLQELKNYMDKYSFLSGGSLFSTGFATIQSTETNNSKSVFFLQVKPNGYTGNGFPTILTAQLNATVDPDVDYTTKTVDWVAGLLQARGLVEYMDNDSNGIYTPGNDTALQVINLSTLTWTLTESQITSSSGYSGYNITLSSTYKGATFEIVAELYNTGVTLSNGVPVSPSEVKLNFIFDNFPWTTSTSRLAFVTVFGGISGNAVATKTDNQTASITYSKTAYAYFTWGSTATVNGQTVNVVAYQNNTNAVHFVELNYPQGSTIVHDPILGIGSDIASMAPTATPIASALPGLYFMVASAVVVAGAAALTLFARKRMVEPKLQF